MLDALERTSSRMAATVNTPPLDVAGLREEWNAIRREAQGLQPASLPSRETIGRMWAELKAEAARHDRSVFETSSAMALSAVKTFPDRMQWLYSSTRIGATRTSQILGEAVLDYYAQTLSDIRQTGYLTYVSRQFRPYLRAAVNQFSPQRKTLTQRVLEKIKMSR